MRFTGYNSLMREVIADVLKGYHADYIEADLEERQDTSMIIAGRGWRRQAGAESRWRRFAGI